MNKVTLAAPMTGWLMSVRDVPDPVFSEEMMGVGVASIPWTGRCARRAMPKYCWLLQRPIR
jgi:phosphotransferase system IIA component